jgi:hypothetical protein
MHPTELFNPDHTSAELYRCGKCQVVHHNLLHAEECCGTYKCRECGTDTGGRHTLLCQACQAEKERRLEAHRFERAEKITTWDGWVHLPNTGRFAPNLQDLLGYLPPNYVHPTYVWTCTGEQFAHVSLDQIIEQMSDNAYEDFQFADLKGVPELIAALEAFNEANKDNPTGRIYHPDYTRALLVPPAE